MKALTRSANKHVPGQRHYKGTESSRTGAIVKTKEKSKQYVYCMKQDRTCSFRRFAMLTDSDADLTYQQPY
jgi:hypothetical protein